MPARSPNDEVQLCAFYLGAQQYAIDLRRVDEIVRPMPITPIPGASPLFDGLATVKDEVVPVIDLRRQLKPTGIAPKRRKPKLLVCRIGPRKLGLMIDGVAEVVHATISELKPAPALMMGANPYVIGVCGPPDEPRLLLDIKALLAGAHVE